MLISVVTILISVGPILISDKMSSTSVLISVLISVKKRRFYSYGMKSTFMHPRALSPKSQHQAA